MNGARDGLGLSPNIVGALWILMSTIIFAVSASLVKYTGTHYTPFVQAFYRQLPALIFMLPVMIRLGPRGLWSPHWVNLLYRSAAGGCAMLLTYYAYQKMPLVSATALSFTRALWLAPLAWIILREKIGLTRTVATVVGFAGILVMLGPEAASGLKVGLPAGAMLLAAFLIATSVIGLKDMAGRISTTVLMCWSTTIGTLVVLPPALLNWRWPDPLDLTLLAATSVTGLVAQACYIQGMRVGEASVVASVDYTRLIFVAVLGYVVFNEIPTGWTVAGGCIVVASTLGLTLREQRLARRARASQAVLESEA